MAVETLWSMVTERLPWPKRNRLPPSGPSSKRRACVSSNPTDSMQSNGRRFSRGSRSRVSVTRNVGACSWLRWSTIWRAAV